MDDVEPRVPLDIVRELAARSAARTGR